MPAHWTERRVVITGLGAVTPLGNDVATFWQNLIDPLQGGASDEIRTRELNAMLPT